jgi:ribosomal protein S18 acetylase RimI-like enzyme
MYADEVMAQIMQEFSIAPATTADCFKCAQLLAEQLSEHGLDASVKRLEQVLKEVIGNERHGFLLVARGKEQMVGIVYVATILSAEHCGVVAWLEELYVTPDCRGQGIGTALLKAVLERAQKQDIVAVDLEIDSAHNRAASLYRRFGFRPLDRSRWVKVVENQSLTPNCGTSGTVGSGAKK